MAAVPKLGLAKIGITPNVANQRKAPSRSAGGSAPRSAPRSAPQPKPASNRSASAKAPSSAGSYKSCRSGAASAASASSVASRPKPTRFSFRPPADRANPAATISPRRNKSGARPQPVRGARPGVIGRKKMITHPLPLWKIKGDAAHPMPAQAPPGSDQHGANAKGKHAKGDRPGTATGELPGGGRSMYETDMHHHLRRVASARKTIDNRAPHAMTKGPLAKQTSLHPSGPCRQSSFAPSEASVSSVASSGGSGLVRASLANLASPKCANVSTTLPRVEEWVHSTATNADPTTANFKVAGAGAESANGVYCFDRESRHGPSFRKATDRRWKLAKGAVYDVIDHEGGSLIKFDNNAQEVDGWYIYNISDWRAVYQLVPLDDRGFTIDTRPERLQMWPPSRSGWAPLTAGDGPAPRITDDLAGTLDVTSVTDLQQTPVSRQQTPVARQSMALALPPAGWTVTRKLSRESSVYSDAPPSGRTSKDFSHLLREDSLAGDKASNLHGSGIVAECDVPKRETTVPCDATLTQDIRMSSTMTEAMFHESFCTVAATDNADVDATHSNPNSPLLGGETGSLGSERSLAAGHTASEGIIPNVLVMTATLDRAGAIDTTLQSSVSTAPLNETFAMADLMYTPAATPAAGTTTAREEEEDKLGTLGRFQRTIDTAGITTIRRRKVDIDPLATRYLDATVSSPPTPASPASPDLLRMTSREAETVAFLTSNAATLQLGRTPPVPPAGTESMSRAASAMDYLDLKSTFSEKAIEHDAHSDSALQLLAAEMITRELNPDLAHRRQDGTLRDPLDEAKMKAALDDVVGAMACAF